MWATTKCYKMRLRFKATNYQLPLIIVMINSLYETYMNVFQLFLLSTSPLPDFYFSSNTGSSSFRGLVSSSFFTLITCTPYNSLLVCSAWWLTRPLSPGIFSRFLAVAEPIPNPLPEPFPRECVIRDVMPLTTRAVLLATLDPVLEWWGEKVPRRTRLRTTRLVLRIVVSIYHFIFRLKDETYCNSMTP